MSEETKILKGVTYSAVKTEDDNEKNKSSVEEKEDASHKKKKRGRKNKRNVFLKGTRCLEAL